MRVSCKKRILWSGMALACVASAGHAQTTQPVHSMKARPAAKTVKKDVMKVVVKEADSVVSVTVKASAEVGGRTFTLGEIADISGGDSDLKAQLAKVEVGTSPLPGLTRLIYPGDITVHLRANHLDSKRVEMLVPPSIRIARAGHDVAVDQITQAAIDATQDAIKNLPNTTLEPGLAGEKVTVPAGKVKIIAGAYRGQLEQGTINVPVSIYVDGKVVQNVEVPLRVHRKASVVVARRVIEPHEILTAEDVVLEAIELPSGFVQPMTDLQEAIGKRAKRRLLAESPVSSAFLETPPAIAANDKITIEYVFGSIHVSAPALARQSGAIGETIRVYALDTRKEMDAVVVKSGIARIVADAADTASDVPDKMPGEPGNPAP